MKKIVTILGARPQFIKAAVLSRIIAKNNKFEEVIVHTGQHFDKNMSGIFFDEMEIPSPKYNLEINEMSHGVMTGHMFEKIEEVLAKEKPQAVVVYGDTNSTLAGALAAKKMHIKVVHVEAGLRSFNMAMPEEVNRVLTDRISDLLLCPSRSAISNLEREGYDHFKASVVNCGDIMKDAVEFYSERALKKSNLLAALGLENTKFVLATIHRQENTDDKDKLASIFRGLEEINTHTKVVLPLHPRTRKKIEEYGLTFELTITDPVGYFDMLALLKHCEMVVTDSGGLQKEAFFHQKHCVIVRDETEWGELVENGFALLAGSNSSKIITAYQDLSGARADFSKQLYGNKVGEKIYTEILNIL